VSAGCLVWVCVAPHLIAQQQTRLCSLMDCFHHQVAWGSLYGSTTLAASLPDLQCTSPRCREVLCTVVHAHCRFVFAVCIMHTIGIEQHVLWAESDGQVICGSLSCVCPLNGISAVAAQGRPKPGSAPACSLQTKQLQGLYISAVWWCVHYLLSAAGREE